MTTVAHAWGNGDWGWGMWLAMTIGMTAMLVTLLAIVWLIVRAVGPPPREAERSGEDRALEELRVRYARGEISGEEFEERREAGDRGDAIASEREDHEPVRVGDRGVAVGAISCLASLMLQGVSPDQATNQRVGTH